MIQMKLHDGSRTHPCQDDRIRVARFELIHNYSFVKSFS